MDRIDEWYKNAKVGTPDLLEWLKGQGPDEWHQAAFLTSFDGDQDRLAWIIDQPGCELSTALCVFWQGEPGFYLREIAEGTDGFTGSMYPKNFALLKRIADNLAGGVYSNRNIGFPTPQPGRDDDWSDFERRFVSYNTAVEEVANTGKTMPWWLPDLAFQKLDGRPVRSEFAIEGGEAHLRYDIWCERNPT